MEAARYRDSRQEAADPVPVDEYAQSTGRRFGEPEADADTAPTRFHETDEVWEVANSAIDAAMARGDFDNLAYAGKPIPGLGTNSDPDWWIKGMLQREQVSGIGPPALMLRKEDAELDELLDAEGSEARVREILTDFNSRIIEARRQLAGGPPVITRLRGIDAEITAWRDRRTERSAVAAPDPAAAAPTPARRGWLARLFGPRGH
ncbi:hypothetical protein GCM10023166_07360 [Paeniglutamicibacter cryotolerans]